MSSPSSLSISKLWLKWKTLKLPWRKKWLAGTDLAGNTFWYFKTGLSPRPRRILQSNPRIAYSDIQISPQWHQWLRYTRPSPPTITEQQADFVRQQELKYLARAADERWAAKPSVLDKPREETLQPTERDDDTGANRANAEGEMKHLRERAEEKKLQEKPPWKIKQGNSGEEYQPEAWAPASKRQ